MHIVMGVIGPEESVERIMKVSREFEEIEFLSFTYQEVNEVIQIIETNKIFVDQWLFSGIFNYSFAIDKQLIQENEGSYPLLYGSSFFGVLLEAQLNEQQIFNRISIDNLTDQEIKKMLSFYKLTDLQFYNSAFKGYEHLETQKDFHKSLFFEGETQLAITSIRAIYEQLKKEGVLVYRLTPSYLSIRLTIQLLSERAQSNRYENRQMAVIGCQLIDDVDHVNQYQLFRRKHHELNLESSLLEITENMSGSFVNVGDGLYFIFTTKGEIDNETENKLFELMHELKIREQLSIGVVIGYGENVSHAEQNVRYGLRMLNDKEWSSILEIDEKQVITTKFPTNEANALNMEAIEKELMSQFDHEEVNHRDALRIIFYSHKYNKESFGSQDVSRWLQSTERNGRRILADLEKANMIEKCGKVRSNQRGRPQNLYQFVEALCLLN